MLVAISQLKMFVLITFQPTQRYVIDAGVRKQEGLRELVLPYGEDTLCMETGGIDIVDEENAGGRSYAPTYH